MNMNPLREKYIEDITDHLKFKAFSNRVDANANDFNFTNADEAFFAELLNLIFNYELSKTELINRNYPAIDLIDDSNKVIVQVTYSVDHAKLEHSTNHEVIEQYSGYTFIYFYTGDDDISSFKKSQRKIENTYNLKFTRSDNIFSTSDIIFKISNIADTKHLERIRDLFPDERLLEPRKISSQLTKVINILKGIKRPYELSSDFEEDFMTYDIGAKINHNNLMYMVY